MVTENASAAEGFWCLQWLERLGYSPSFMEKD